MATDNVSIRVILQAQIGSCPSITNKTSVGSFFWQRINANNSWSFALINYFRDTSLLQNNTDNSINLQRASCAPDRCARIWTSLVHSVSDERTKSFEVSGTVQVEGTLTTRTTGGRR